jgi:hypothetical protein
MPKEFEQMYHPYLHLEAKQTVKDRREHADVARRVEQTRDHRAKLFIRLRARLNFLVGRANSHVRIREDIARIGELMPGCLVSSRNSISQNKKGAGKNQKEETMLYESHVRPRIEALIKEAEEERLLKMAEPSKSEVQRLLPYAIALAFIVIAIVWTIPARAGAVALAVSLPWKYSWSQAWQRTTVRD